MLRTTCIFRLALLLAVACPMRPAMAQETSFFVTSEGLGKGGDLGGL
jgi:hypothetical protein